MDPDEKKARTMLRFAAFMTEDALVRCALDPYIEYVAKEDNLPAGYHEAIQDYWDRKCGAEQLNMRLDAIDGSAAFHQLVSRACAEVPLPIRDDSP